MKIVYGQVENLFKALEALKTQPQSFSIARKLKDTRDAVIKEREWCSEQIRLLVDQFGEKSEDGKPVVNESGGYQLVDPEGFSESFSELLSTQTGEIPVITEELLQCFTVSAEQLDSLMLIMEVSDDG